MAERIFWDTNSRVPSSDLDPLLPTPQSPLKSADYNTTAWAFQSGINLNYENIEEITAKLDNQFIKIATTNVNNFSSSTEWFHFLDLESSLDDDITGDRVITFSYIIIGGQNSSNVVNTYFFSGALIFDNSYSATNLSTAFSINNASGETLDLAYVVTPQIDQDSGKNYNVYSIYVKPSDISSSFATLNFYKLDVYSQNAVLTVAPIESGGSFSITNQLSTLGTTDTSDTGYTTNPIIASAYVDSSSNQTIGGTKTFSNPVLGVNSQSPNNAEFVTYDLLQNYISNNPVDFVYIGKFTNYADLPTSPTPLENSLAYVTDSDGINDSGIYLYQITWQYVSLYGNFALLDTDSYFSKKNTFNGGIDGGGVSEATNFSDPTQTQSLTTKNYVDNNSFNIAYINTNKTISGLWTYNTSPIVPTPTQSGEAVNKNYVDSANNLINTNISTLQDKTQKLDSSGNFTQSPTAPEPTSSSQVATKNYVDNNSGGGGGAGNTASLTVSDPTTESLSQTATNQQDINQENKTQIQDTTTIAVVGKEILTEWLTVQIQNNATSLLTLSNSGSNGVWNLSQTISDFEIILVDIKIKNIEYQIILATQLLSSQSLTFGPYTFTYDSSNLTLTVSPTTDITDYGPVNGITFTDYASLDNLANETNSRVTQDTNLQEQITKITTTTSTQGENLGTLIIAETISTFDRFKQLFFSPTAPNTNINIKDSTDTYWVDSEFYYDTQGNAYSSGYTTDHYGVTKWTNTLPNATFSVGTGPNTEYISFAGYSGFPDVGTRYFGAVEANGFSLDNVLPYGTFYVAYYNIKTKNNGKLLILHTNNFSNPFIVDLSDSLNTDCYGVAGFDVVQSSNDYLQPESSLNPYYLEDQNQNKLYPSVFGIQTIQSYSTITFTLPSGSYDLDVSTLSQGVPVWVLDNNSDNLIQVQISPYNPNQLQLLQWNENNDLVKDGTTINVYNGDTLTSFETDPISGELTLKRPMNADSFAITNAQDPVDIQDVATKNYVDSNTVTGTASLTVDDPFSESLGQAATTQQQINQENRDFISADTEILLWWLNIQARNNIDSYLTLATSGSSDTSSGFWVLNQPISNFQLLIAELEINNMTFKFPLPTQSLLSYGVVYGKYTFTYYSQNSVLIVAPLDGITGYGPVYGITFTDYASLNNLATETNSRIVQDTNLQEQITKITTAATSSGQDENLGTLIIGETISTFNRFKEVFFSPTAPNTNVNIKDSTDTFWVDSEHYYDKDGTAYSSGTTNNGYYGVSAWINTLPNATFGAEEEPNSGAIRFAGYIGFPNAEFRYFAANISNGFSLDNVLPYGTGESAFFNHIKTKNNGKLLLSSPYSSYPFLVSFSDSLNTDCYGVSGFGVVQSSSDYLQPESSLTPYYLEDQNQNKLLPSVFGTNTIQSYSTVIFTLPSGSYDLDVSTLSQGVPVWVLDNNSDNLIQVQISPYNPNQLQLLQWNENNDLVKDGTTINIYGGDLAKSFETNQNTGEFTLLNTMDANGYNIINSPDPVNSQDAATKNYIDSMSLQQLTLVSTVGSTLANSEADVDLYNYPNPKYYPKLNTIGLDSVYPNLLKINSLWSNNVAMNINVNFLAQQNSGGSRNVIIRVYSCDSVGNVQGSPLETSTVTIGGNSAYETVSLNFMTTITPLTLQYFCFTIEASGTGVNTINSFVDVQINPMRSETPTTL